MPSVGLTRVMMLEAVVNRYYFRSFLPKNSLACRLI